MDMQTKWAAEEFLRHIESSPAIERFREVQNTYNHDPGVTRLQEQFLALTQELHTRKKIMPSPRMKSASIKSCSSR